MGLTVNEIVEQYLKTTRDYRTQEILHKLVECGSGKLGYHIDVCDSCGIVKVIANPCNHSLCTVCQERRSKLWIESRIPELLPVPHYHIIFCLIADLSDFAMFNKKLVYDSMFIAVASAMNEIPERDNIEIGFISSLHTSTASLWYKLHMHVCTPGIGLLKNGKVNKYTSIESLRMTEEQLQKKFRDVILENLQKKYLEDARKIEEDNMEEVLSWSEEEDYEDEKAERIKWPESLKELKDDEQKFNKWIEQLRNKKWDVEIGNPRKSEAEKRSLIEYIGQRLPITDRQLIEADDETVIFKDKRGKKIVMATEEFIRRLKTHIMPPYYHRIRNYGFLSNPIKTKKLKEIREKLGLGEAEKNVSMIIDCKECGKGEMQTVATLLGGGTVKTFEKNIKKLKKLPGWLSPLQEVDSLPKAPPEVVSKLPDWLIELIQSVDDY